MANQNQIKKGLCPPPPPFFFGGGGWGEWRGGQVCYVSSLAPIETCFHSTFNLDYCSTKSKKRAHHAHPHHHGRRKGKRSHSDK